MISKKQVIAELTAMGITVKDGMIKKSDIEKALSASGAASKFYYMEQEGRPRVYFSKGMGLQEYSDNSLSSDAIADWLKKANQDMHDLHKHIARDTGLPISKVEAVSLSKGGEAVYKISSDKELSAQEIEQLKEAMVGQLSDGWGEGFSQRWQYEEYTGYKNNMELQYEYDPWAARGRTTITTANALKPSH